VIVKQAIKQYLVSHGASNFVKLHFVLTLNCSHLNTADR